jgi:tyrosine-protein kinase Etk/Wzc
MASTNERNEQDWFAGQDVLAMFAKWRKFIFVNVLFVSIGAIGISLILPKWYKASTSILPPKEQGSLSSLGMAGALLKGAGSSLAKIGTLSNNSGAYNYLAILKSRSLAEAVIRKFNLIDAYGIPDSSMELALKEFGGNVSFEVQSEDFILIEASDKDPQRAADIANHIVEMLNTVSIRLGTQEAHSNREFIEQRVSKIYDDLHRAEDAFKTFQEKSPMPLAPDLSTSAISSIAELYAMKAKKEIEIAILERTVSKDNPVLAQYRIEQDEIEKKVAGIPEAGISTLRLYREVMIQQKILEFVLPLLEQARVDEQKNIPVTLVLDKATAPEKKDRPKRSLIVAVAALSALLLSILYILVAEKLRHLKQTNPARHALLLSVFQRRPAR